MRNVTKAIMIFGILVLILLAIFGMGRYGWKLGGFHACQSAGIVSVEVSQDAVHIAGFYPGSFPEGFCGCYAREQDGRLYVGFRFSAVFGFFETGNFDITIPVKGEIGEVVMKTSRNESVIWTADKGFVPQSERYGVYVKLERNDVASVTMAYQDFSGGMAHADNTALESGRYIFMDNDIMQAAKEADAPVPFTVTAWREDGNALAAESFYFDASMEKLYLTVTADGMIQEDDNERG